MSAIGTNPNLSSAGTQSLAGDNRTFSNMGSTPNQPCRRLYSRVNPLVHWSAQFPWFTNQSIHLFGVWALLETTLVVGLRRRFPRGTTFDAAMLARPGRLRRAILAVDLDRGPEGH